MKIHEKSNLKETPISLKLSPVTRARVEQAAVDLNWSYSHVMSETIEQTLCQAMSTTALIVPEILVRLRMIEAQKNQPVLQWDRVELPDHEETARE